MTVSDTVPVGVVPVVVTASVAVPEGDTGDGVMVHVVFAGQPVTDRLTLPAKPASAVRVTVDEPAAPGARVSDVGLADIEKSGVAGVPHPLNLKDPNQVAQLKLPLAGSYSVA